MPVKTPKSKVLPPALMPQGKMPRTWAFHDHPWFWLVKHAFGRWFRAHRACPNCGSMGTWKAYGYWWKDRDVRRWLCKWCGFYDGVDGRYWCAISTKIGAWAKREEADMQTPEEFAREKGFNPWVG